MSSRDISGRDMSSRDMSSKDLTAVEKSAVCGMSCLAQTCLIFSSFSAGCPPWHQPYLLHTHTMTERATGRQEVPSPTTPTPLHVIPYLTGIKIIISPHTSTRTKPHLSQSHTHTCACTHTMPQSQIQPGVTLFEWLSEISKIFIWSIIKIWG